MSEEVWSGSSLGSSLLNDDDNLSLRSSLVDREMQIVTEKYLSRRDGDLQNDPPTKDIYVERSTSLFGLQEIVGADEVNQNSENPYQFLGTTQEEGSDTSHDIMGLILPSFARLSNMLNENGCLTLSVTTKDIDVDNRSISVFVLDSWAESIVSFIAEMLGQRQNNRDQILEASYEVQKGDISISNLDVEVHHLTEKLKTAKEKEKQLRLKSSQSDDLIERLQKQMEDLKLDCSRQVKRVERLSEEKERKIRMSELEGNKMREKLRLLTKRDRSGSDKKAETLKKFNRGAVVVSSAASSPGKGGDSVVSVDDVVEAMEGEHDELRSRNEELEQQVVTLTKRLKKALNEQLPASSLSTAAKQENIVFNFKDSSSASTTSDNVHKGDAVDNDVLVLSDKLTDKSQRIRQLSHQLEVESATVKKQSEDMKVLRRRAGEMRDEIHNLRLEIESRPTMPQWNGKVKEVAALESKLHDVVMMKGEAEELQGWRRHLSTSDRIKADRRNHELKLWLLESLPKSVMQEVLQNLCRELDISDVSEILPGVIKMKTVIRAVPRMERFITMVCNFVFQKDRPRHPEGDLNTRPVMEDVMPLLKRWWSDLEASQKYTKFQQDVTAELSRMDALSSSRGGPPPTHITLLSPPGDLRRGVGMAGEVSVVQRIKSLVDFQIELFRSSKSFVDAQTFISERPEVLVNSLVEHIRYLFGVKTLQGVIPRMNEVYLFSEEMCNFISNSREMMKMSHVPDATVLTEIYRRIEKCDPVKVPTRKEHLDQDTEITEEPSSSSSVISDFVDDGDDADDNYYLGS